MSLPGWLARVDAKRRSLGFDVLLALTVLLQLNVWFGQEEGEVFEIKPLSAVLMLLLTVPLVWRRSAPLAVAACNGFGRAAQVLATGSWVASQGILLASLVAVYSAGAYGKGPRAWLGLGCLLGGLLVASAYDLPSNEADLWNGLFFHLLGFLVFAAGLYVRGRRRSAELELRTERLERERAERARAVAEERARIARELHDVVAHSVSATVVQAEAAEEVLGRAPDRARQSLVRIQDTGREALGEMRRLLGIMRDDPHGGELAPQPRVADVERLVEETRGRWPAGDADRRRRATRAARGCRTVRLQDRAGGAHERAQARRAAGQGEHRRALRGLGARARDRRRRQRRRRTRHPWPRLGRDARARRVLRR
jgi:signal transduction histidine kinase